MMNVREDCCGNCINYERGNAWSGLCSLTDQHTSPGLSCADFRPSQKNPTPIMCARCGGAIAEGVFAMCLTDGPIHFNGCPMAH